ncbi:aspartate aminotransferase family protein [Candidatus Heimdallarchaeota archaeon]|nr:MAG: aspartate aminotransferase family protein [Candidatus Heimdallarchaeota archaeon]
MQSQIDYYRQNHLKSLELWKDAQKRFPGGVSHNIRDFNMSLFDLSPPFIKEAQDVTLIDVDGNELLDYWITHGSAILGHAPEPVMNAIAEQLQYGNHYGMVNEQALALAEKLIEATPSIEKLRFCTTGTEATMYASRLARAFTGKKKVLKVRGGWHGGNDTLFFYVKNMLNGRESNGLHSQKEAYVETFDYNDTEGFQELLRNEKDVAAVVMEPVLGAGGAIAPREGFLETIREETEKKDILLIYDEIITGFRLGYHSGQGIFGIKPDITTLGKIVGGGAPIGVIGGRKDILNQADLTKEEGSVWIGGGTFSGNPVSMVAGLATIRTLEKGGNELYRKLNEKGTYLRKKITALINDYNAPVQVCGIGSMGSVHWLKEKKRKIRLSSELKQLIDKERVANFQLLMLNNNILVRGGLGYLSVKHTQEDIDRTIKVMEKAISFLVKKQ